MKIIKELRRSKNESQTDLADAIGVSLRTIQNYESGKVDVPRKNLEKIAQHYDVNLAYLFGDAERKEEAQKVSFDNLNVMHVPIVNKYAYAGYLNGFGDDEYIDELPKIPFANDVENKGDYLCFEVKGDSMDDGSYESYLEGDILLCRNIRPELWLNKLHIDKWDFVIVHKEHGILVKRIIEHKVDEGIIKLHSLNEYYEDFEVHLSDVQKLFNIVDFRRKRNRR